jgi:hypothetical protein
MPILALPCLAFRSVTTEASLLAEERLARMQNAQNLVWHTLLVERELLQHFAMSDW